MEYDPQIELEKGADLTSASYDATQSVLVRDDKVTVGGRAGSFEISGVASGGDGSGSIDGSVMIWLSIFRYTRPDGTVNHVAGWNITVRPKRGQTAEETAAEFADYINSYATRPYTAEADGSAVSIIYCEEERKQLLEDIKNI